MNDDIQYAVYLHEGALAALGEAVTPYISQGAHGPHLLCTDIDTGGALCEMSIEVCKDDGKVRRCEVMVPIAMIRLVLSIASDEDHFGFRSVEHDKPAGPVG